MKVINLEFSVRKPFGNLFRRRTVLIAVENKDGKILIGDKPGFYPPTISRLLGGGVDDGEDIVVAAVRELEEELGVIVCAADLVPLATFTCRVVDEDATIYNHETTVYYTNIGSSKVKPGDDIKSISQLTVDELYKLGVDYDKLSDALWYKGPEGEFCWADYAKLYGLVHRTASEEIKNIKPR